MLQLPFALSELNLLSSETVRIITNRTPLLDHFPAEQTVTSSESYTVFSFSFNNLKCPALSSLCSNLPVVLLFSEEMYLLATLGHTWICILFLQHLPFWWREEAPAVLTVSWLRAFLGKSATPKECQAFLSQINNHNPRGFVDLSLCRHYVNRGWHI